MNINLKNYYLLLCLIVICGVTKGQEFQHIDIDSEITQVQPMTGIVLWPENNNVNTDAISLEYAYMDFSEIVIAKDKYDWTVVEALLDKISGRNHQAVLRFRFSYPGRTTTVPQYIKDLPDYNETQGLSEGETTWFPDWTHPELKEMTLAFYTEYAARYDLDSRLAFVQVGFGLWAEYHIYSGPFTLGVTFPDKEFQKVFFTHLSQVFQNTYWSISIDAADDTYSPFEQDPAYKDIIFGLFDDSFMHENHSGYNTSSWNFFDRERYKLAPAGGEFSYYSDYDQENILNSVVGAYGIPYEIFAEDFHISYIIGNDQTNFHSLDRIKEASLNSGYKFKLLSVKTSADSAIVEVINLGVAPLYIDAYLAVNGVRSSESLKLLGQDESKIFHISSGGTEIKLTIESDDILETEVIEYYGTINDYARYTLRGSTSSRTGSQSDAFKIFPTIADHGNINIDYSGKGHFSVTIFDSSGTLHFNNTLFSGKQIDINKYSSGLYYVICRENNGKQYIEKIVIQK